MPINSIVATVLNYKYDKDDTYSANKESTPFFQGNRTPIPVCARYRNKLNEKLSSIINKATLYS